MAGWVEPFGSFREVMASLIMCDVAVDMYKRSRKTVVEATIVIMKIEKREKGMMNKTTLQNMNLPESREGRS